MLKSIYKKKFYKIIFEYFIHIVFYYLILFILLFSKLNSEEKHNTKSDSISKKNNTFYIELRGNVLLFFSANYEFIFKDDFIFEQDISHLGFRVGIGAGYMVNGGTVTMLNWQLGKLQRLEIGAGFLYTFGNPLDSWHETNLEGTNNNILYTFTFGYKHIFESGWIIRVGLTPIISVEGYFQNSAGISVGMNF